MPELDYTPRAELADREWDPECKEWIRPRLDREILRRLSKRSTHNGLLRIGLFAFFLAAVAVSVIFVGRHSLLAAVPVLYVYFFFYGFWVAIDHELQHKTVFAGSFDWFSEIVFFVAQTFMWNSPRYARISHRLHHRYTMVRGIDPETDWPAIITSQWLRNFLFGLILKILVVGAAVDLVRAVVLQIRRIAGVKDRMMRDYCSDKDIAVIRIESLGILLIHLAVIACAILLRRWGLIILFTVAWQIGSPIEGLWHFTEHIGRLYNVNDHRLCTRSVRVNPFIKLIFWGLDDHVDHHYFPVVPSRDLPELHRILREDLAEPKGMIGCWVEMFAIAREKDRHPEHEYVSA